MGPRARRDTVEKRKIPSPCRESNPDRPARILVTQWLYYDFFLYFVDET